MDALRKITRSILVVLSLSFLSYLVFAQASAEVGSTSDATSVWSPDRQTLARVEVAQLIGTPAGSNSCLYLNSRAVYPVAHPKNCEPHPKGIYDGIHVFLTPPEWSPDSRKVAIVTRIFDWEYTDPYGRYWDGTLSDDRYDLIIASIDRPALGYPIHQPAGSPAPQVGPRFYSGAAAPIVNVKWLSDSQLSVDGLTFDLNAQPPAAVQ
jgi:hypothetical protein